MRLGFPRRSGEISIASNSSRVRMQCLSGKVIFYETLRLSGLQVSLHSFPIATRFEKGLFNYSLIVHLDARGALPPSVERRE